SRRPGQRAARPIPGSRRIWGSCTSAPWKTPTGTPSRSPIWTCPRSIGSCYTRAAPCLFTCTARSPTIPFPGREARMLAGALSRYAAIHFIDEALFSRSANIERALFRDLIAAGALPGAIYRIWDSGAVWSPIGGWVDGEETTAPQSEWFSPAAVWWARRASVFLESGTPLAQVADALRETFLADFRAVLETLPIARLAYPDAFPEGRFDPQAGQDAGLAEWADWINGGYGVCLRRFDARSLAVKAGEAARVRAITESGTRETLTPAEKLDLLDAMERLDAVMLPFAPHQRPKGTPGFWVD